VSNRSPICINGRQRGAALVVGLILLLVLSVLAISGMSSSSLELLMAGNEQYLKDSFQAAEAGIERALSQDNLFTPGVNQPAVNNTAMQNSVGDTYSYQVTSDLNGHSVQASVTGYSVKFPSYHYLIVSTGRSSRSSRAIHSQGAAYIAPANGTDDFAVCGAAGAEALTAGDGSC
jgi:type IV pilus assembly protein PilX